MKPRSETHKVPKASKLKHFVVWHVIPWSLTMLLGTLFAFLIMAMMEEIQR